MSDHFYEPKSGHGLVHNPFKAIIAPRPIGWISSCNEKGEANLAPYSFFNGLMDVPPIVMFSTNHSRKDSLNNIEKTGEFVVNFVGMHQAQPMNVTSASVGPEVNEFDLASLEQVPSRLVKPPRVADAIAAMECKLTQILHLKNHAGEPIDAWVTMGEVIGIHINNRFIKDGVFDITLARPIGRCGALGDYVEVREVFQMVRPGS
jgi:flavin reductase (DIM6/NTAB) family NADH-FMN oxidoreductase RutF